MTDFSVTITDPSQLAGVTAARAEHNANLAPVLDDSDQPMEPNPNAIATDADYVQFVMQSAAVSYANHYGT